MTKEMEVLQKAINGKLVVFEHNGATADCLILWPPNRNVVSFKPYGYTPEELLEFYVSRYGIKENIAYFKRDSYCFGVLNLYLDRTGKATLPALQEIAEIEDGGLMDIVFVFSKIEDDNPTGDGASCPYG